MHAHDLALGAAVGLIVAIITHLLIVAWWAVRRLYDVVDRIGGG